MAQRVVSPREAHRGGSHAELKPGGEVEIASGDGGEDAPALGAARAKSRKSPGPAAEIRHAMLRKGARSPKRDRNRADPRDRIGRAFRRASSRRRRSP